MVWLAIAGLFSRRLASILAALGLLTATTGFVLLVNTSKTTEAVLTGDIRASWPAPYDILVRGSGLLTDLERSEGVIRPNYLAGGRGGITLEQLKSIRQIPGVEIAAPIAVVGFARWPVGLPIDLSKQAAPAKITFFRITSQITAESGLSKYPAQTLVLAAAPDGKLVLDPSREITIPGSSVRHLGSSLVVGDQHYECPIDTPQACYAPLLCPSPNQCMPNLPVQGLADGVPGYFVDFAQPILMAGVDPVAEARLVNLDRCLVAGRPLTGQDQARWSVGPGGRLIWELPLLASARSFIDETLRVQVQMGTGPASPPKDDVGGAWSEVSDQTVSADDLYRSFLPHVGDRPQALPFWVPGDVSYNQLGRDHLIAAARDADTSIYTEIGGFPAPSGRQYLVPPEARDVWMRPVVQRREIVAPDHSASTLWSYGVVGQYEPGCLPGFSALSGGSLESYAVPAVRLPNGGQLKPTRSVGGYMNSPPLLLTTLDVARFFADPGLFTGALGNKFISEIRVRVAGTQQPSQAAIDRLGRVAAEIHDGTGLQVDIVRGSSARPVAVDLPAGKYGRPALKVTEGWSEKGAAVRFGRAVLGQNIALFGLVLVMATGLVGQTAYTAVRMRRREFGILRALGWPSARVAGLVELEMVVLGIVVGLAGALLGLGLSIALRLEVVPGQLALTLPLAPAVAGLAGIVPALAATRGTTVSVMRGRSRVRASRPPSSAWALGLMDLAGRRPIEALLGAGTIALGAGMVGAVGVISSAFQGQLDTTLLGVHLAARVQPFHAALAALALVVGGLTAGEIAALSYLERKPHLAVLRSLGWPRRRVAEVIASQGLAIGVGGGLLAAALIAVGGMLVGATIGSTALAAVESLFTATVVSVLATVIPVLHAYRLAPALALKAE